DDSQAIPGDLKLEEVDLLFGAFGDFVLGEGPRGVGDVELAVVELLGAAAGAGDADGDAHARMILTEIGRRRFGDQVDGARSVDLDVPLQRLVARQSCRGANCQSAGQRGETKPSHGISFHVHESEPGPTLLSVRGMKKSDES